ncbi:hypothetical protein K435DRAFT_194325 [Dendrothele bispora CBS 962.96]|uniref:Uncharacterized protein n=1 Tax=Dendrothele bispora (strain CBS 962.96) TaxID=1314807 RepID=A0A4S8LUT4_DENBC|nr:hypothetical protein K435DRAFT_194325 [Dendrothele bispora CBS 962.96]
MVAGRVLQTFSDPSFNSERQDTLLGYMRILELHLIPDDRDFSSAHWSSTFPVASMC